jgi:hypothetical protein
MVHNSVIQNNFTRIWVERLRIISEHWKYRTLSCFKGLFKKGLPSYNPYVLILQSLLLDFYGFASKLGCCIVDTFFFQNQQTLKINNENREITEVKVRQD